MRGTWCTTVLSSQSCDTAVEQSGMECPTPSLHPPVEKIVNLLRRRMDEGLPKLYERNARAFILNRSPCLRARCRSRAVQTRLNFLE